MYTHPKGGSSGRRQTQESRSTGCVKTCGGRPWEQLTACHRAMPPSVSTQMPLCARHTQRPHPQAPTSKIHILHAVPTRNPSHITNATCIKTHACKRTQTALHAKPCPALLRMPCLSSSGSRLLSLQPSSATARRAAADAAAATALVAAVARPYRSPTSQQAVGNLTQHTQHNRLKSHSAQTPQSHSSYALTFFLNIPFRVPLFLRSMPGAPPALLPCVDASSWRESPAAMSLCEGGLCGPVL
jgi:hypothetical protein